jgi:hypothetical protein
MHFCDFAVLLIFICIANRSVIANRQSLTRTPSRSIATVKQTTIDDKLDELLLEISAIRGELVPVLEEAIRSLNDRLQRQRETIASFTSAFQNKLIT